MSAQPPPSNPNPFDELKQGVQESPPLDEFKAGLADKQPLVQSKQPRYAFGWFDKWLLLIPAGLLVILLLLAWVSCNPTQPAAPQDVTLTSATAGTPAAVGQPLQITGTAPPGAVVQLYNRDQLLSETTADANGNFQFNLMPAQPGEYELHIVTTVNGKPVESAVLAVTVQGVAANVPTSTAASSGAANVPTAVQAQATQSAGANVTAQPPVNATAIETAVGTASSAPSTSATESAATISPADATSAAATTSSADATNAAATISPANATSAAATISPANATSAAATTSSADATGAAATISPADATSVAATISPADATSAPVSNTPPSQVTEPAANATSSTAAAETPGASVTGAPTAVSTTSVSMPTASDGTPAATATLTAEAVIGATTPAAGTPTTGSGAANLIPPTVNLTANGIVVVGSVISGTAQPNQVVVIYFNDLELARVDADATGKWEFRVPMNLAPGKYVVRVVVMDANGKPIVSAPQAIVVQVAPSPLLPVTGGQCK